MKTKQLVGIIVTGIVIIAVGVTGVFSNIVGNKLLGSKKDANSIMDSLLADTSVELPDHEFVGVINIIGEIGPSTTGSWGSSDGEYNHDLYMNYIDQMMDSELNKGILLYVDSPGGNVYESDELYLKLMEYKKETSRPIWAYFASEACSGGYYISMAADRIYANRNCWTGSIGVIVSLTNCKGLYDKLGIKEIDITSGANKAMGSAGLDLTEEQYDILQSLVDEAYDQFVEIVVNGRGMSTDVVKKIADGRIYSAKQAEKNGLIDEIGSLEEEKEAFIDAEKLGMGIDFFSPDTSVSGLMQTLFGMAENMHAKSDTELAVDIMENKGNGVLKYYAD